MTVSAASSSTPAKSRYHHSACRFSVSSRDSGSGAAAPPRGGRVAGHGRDELGRIEGRQVGLGGVDVDGDRLGPPGGRP